MIIGMWSINNSYYRQSKRTYCVTYKPFQCGRLKYPSIVDLLPHDSKTSDKPEQYDWRAKKNWTGSQTKSGSALERELHLYFLHPISIHQCGDLNEHLLAPSWYLLCQNGS